MDRSLAVASLPSGGNSYCLTRERIVGRMRETLRLLRTAVDNGELSVTDYYTEADGVYLNMQSFLDLERQYQGVVADVMKNEL